jgi:hypothetical protein
MTLEAACGSTVRAADKVLSQRAVSAGRYAELRSKGAVEIGDVSKTTLERNVGDASGFGSQSQGGPAQAHPNQILMRSSACYFFKYAEKVIRAQARGVGKRAQVLRGICFIFDHSDDPGYACP